MPAILPNVRVFDAQKVKIFFPIRSFFRQRRFAEAGLNPGRNPVRIYPRLVHIIHVLVAGDRSLAKASIVDRIEQRLGFAEFYPGP